MKAVVKAGIVGTAKMARTALRCAEDVVDVVQEARSELAEESRAELAPEPRRGVHAVPSPGKGNGTAPSAVAFRHGS